MSSLHTRDFTLTPELNADFAKISNRIITALDQLDQGEGVSGDPAEILGKVLEAARNRHAR